ncbi:MAG: type II toxin-antitoxin system VapC family toxin [Gemmatimonas sp.]|nr:PIN domain-containing protein [Gemmatimonadaceae bacterium]
MPAEVFVDTSAWYPLLLRTHPDHERLAAQLRALIKRGRRIVTTNLVIAETHALAMRRIGPAPALTFAQTVIEPPNIVVHSTAELEAKAVRVWLERFRDHDFSFTDAVSFAVMTERRIDEAMTLEHHFEVAGFRAVRA